MIAFIKDLCAFVAILAFTGSVLLWAGLLTGGI